MKRTASLSASIVLLGGFFFMFSIKPAHAYIDIGSVSVYLQMLIAGVFGFLFGIKVYWRNLTDKISRLIAFLKRTKPNSK